MSMNEESWLDARDIWGVDRLAWEDDDDEGADDRAVTDRDGRGRPRSKTAFSDAKPP
jgi:hypothetical protein